MCSPRQDASDYSGEHFRVWPCEVCPHLSRHSMPLALWLFYHSIILYHPNLWLPSCMLPSTVRIWMRRYESTTRWERPNSWTTLHTVSHTTAFHTVTAAFFEIRETISPTNENNRHSDREQCNKQSEAGWSLLRGSNIMTSTQTLFSAKTKFF